MSIRFLSNLFLVICLFCGVSRFSCVSAADLREQFSIIWKDSDNRDAILSCLNQCISSEESLLNVTKHLIGHSHVLDISETHGKLPASFLLISSPEGVGYLNFLRGLYTVRGNLAILKSSVNIASKLNTSLNTLRDIENAFSYVSSYELIARQRDAVLSAILGLRAILGTAENLRSAARCASTFLWQLNEGKDFENLNGKISSEIAVYEGAGIEISDMARIISDSESIGGLTNELLIECISQIKERASESLSDTLLRASGSIAEVEQIIDLEFFQLPGVDIVDELVKRYFLGFTRLYLENFSSYIGTALVTKNVFEEGWVDISLAQELSREEFKKFVLSSLRQSIEIDPSTIDPPTNDVKVLLVFKSKLGQDDHCPYTVSVESGVYSIERAYLATFFPSTIRRRSTPPH